MKRQGNLSRKGEKILEEGLRGGEITMTGGKRIHKDMNIGEIIDRYPEAQQIFQKHFGEGCYTCPGSRMETISFGALMHNKDPNAIVEDLNSKIKL